MTSAVGSTQTIERTDLSGDYAIDPAHTRIGFVARHAMVTKVRGSFNDFEGTIHIDAEDLSRSNAEVTIQAESIDTRNEDRDAHLRSNDFFAMEQYPEITFATTKIEQVDDSTFRVTGDLTVRGETRSITMDVDHTGAAIDPWDNLRIGFEGSVIVNRKEWGITWNAALEAGGVLVSDKATLEFEVSAVKQS